MFNHVKVIVSPTDWDCIFMQEAALWSRRSHDSQTQCGCVIVKEKTVISTGYNGFIRDIDDSDLPKTRPKKYPFMIHAEANAIYNSVRIGRSTLGAKVYITAPPCINCLQMLYQCGIKEVIFSDVSNPKMCIYNDDYATILKKMKDKIDIKYLPISNIDNKNISETFEIFTKKNKERVDKRR